MPSTTESNSGVHNHFFGESEDGSAIVARMILTASAAIISWIVLLVLIYMTDFPGIAPQQDGQPPSGPELLSVKLAAGIMIAHLASTSGIQLLAPQMVIQGRLASNTMIGGLLIALCASLSAIGQVLPSDAVPYLKQALAIAYHPLFVIANFLSCAVIGLIIYLFRETRPFDQAEIYWSLASMFLLGLSIALAAAIASIP